MPRGKLEQVSGWCLGQILKQDTDKGYYFFKATAFLPLFSNESMLCLTLSELMPHYVPDTLCSLTEKQWMISKDFGGGLAEGADISSWINAFRQFSKLQIESTQYVNVLIDNGCLQRKITDIPRQLSQLLNDPDITANLPKKLTSHKEDIVLNVRRHVEELVLFNIPDTLVHGDLHIENIAQHKDEFIFFDWSDACISHPFIDGTYVFRMPDNEDKKNIIEAYLAPWLYLADIETLKSAWNKAELVCYAHQAISYASMKKTLPKEQMQDLEQAYLNAFNRLIDTSGSNS
ncbi:phosphotransferase [Shewanella sp. 125m-7]